MESSEHEGPGPGPLRPPFVGREIELEWLLRRLRRAAQGQPRACLVRGDPGIGKSRLLTELGRHALRDGLRVWALRGSPALQTPYLALDSLIQDLATRCMSGPSLAEASAGWWQHLERDVGEEPEKFAAAPSGPSQHALSLAFQAALFERASHGGFLLLIDDLQWIDGPSLDLIVAALQAAGAKATEASVPLAVIMASRDGVRGSTAEWAEQRLEFELICETLDLRGFDDREAEEFVRQLGIDPPARALATRLRDATQGNPERLQGVVAELRRQDALRRRGRSWVAIVDPLEIVGSNAAATLDLAVGDPLRQVLRVLGRIEHEAPSAAVAAALDTTTDVVEALLADAVERGWLRRGAGGFYFDDPAVGRALASEFAESERPALHLRIASWLEASGDADPEALAYHWMQARPSVPDSRVIETLRSAAQQAMRARDWRRAAFHYERAVQLAEACRLPEAQSAELHYRAGLAHFRSLDGAPSRIHFDQAAALYQACGDAAGELRARLEAMRSIVSLSGAAFGSRTPGLAEIEQLIERLGKEEPALQAYAAAELAVAHAMARDMKTAEPMARRAVQVSLRASDDVRCLAYENLGIVLTAMLDIEGAACAYRDSLRFARRTGDAWLESLSLNRLPIALVWQGHLDEARSYLLSAREAAETSGDTADYSLALGTLAALALARGEFEEVESLARQAVSVARRSGYTWGAAMAISAVAPARALRGRLDDALEAAALLETPSMLAREVPPIWAAMASVLRMRLSALAGEADDDTRGRAAGIASLLVATDLDPHVLPALCACVEIAAQSGDVVLAERAAIPILEAARRGVVFTPALDDVLARSLGLVAEVSGRHEDALARLEEALEAAERGGARMLQGRIHADLARVLASLGRSTESTRNAEQALQLAERLQMEPLRVLCARRLASADAASVPRKGSEALRAEERRLLRGIAAGFDDGALAIDLLLTREGVGRLRGRVFRQIGASNDLEAAAFAHREGLAVPVRRRSSLEEISRRAPPVHSREPSALTVFVSDIANSMDLIQRLGDEAAQSLIHEHNQIVRAGLRRQHGVELQHTGDGFIASFESAARALRCAVDLQQELLARRLGPAASPLRVRVGLHLGEPLLEEGRVFGAAMHTAARICGKCEGGQILVSGAAWRAAGPELWLPADDLGPVALRGVFEPIPLHRVRWDHATRPV